MDADTPTSGGKRSIPSFMKPTASLSQRQHTRAEEKQRGVDAAAYFTRDSNTPGFVTSTRPPVSKVSPASRLPATSRFVRECTPTSIPTAAGQQTPPSRTASGAEADHSGPLDESWDRVKVFVRARPAMFAGETPGAITIDGNDANKITVKRHDGLVPESRFTFDKVFNTAATQQEVYNEAVRPVVQDVLLGYHGTVMCYGQTGAGKTYTLVNMDAKSAGMMPRALADIFNHAAADALHTYRVYMSYVQIYMEVIKDLLVPSEEQLQVREDGNGVFLSGVHEEAVTCTQDCLALLQRGEENRVFASTDMNAHSSRSHAIVIVTVFKQRKRAQTCVENGQEVVGRQTTMGRLFLVDLAGSERLKKSRSVGVRATEAKHINLSLTTLGMCVNARSDPAATHVPFRDSKLTRLIQESLGGNAKTSMVIACCDVREHADETLQSLLFGSRAILVKNAARVNTFVDLSAMNDEIARQLQTVDPESAMERALLDREEQVTRLEAALSARAAEAGALQQRLDAARAQLAEAQAETSSSAMSIAALTLSHGQELERANLSSRSVAQQLAAAEASKADVVRQLAERGSEVSELRREVANAQAAAAEARAAEARAQEAQRQLAAERDAERGAVAAAAAQAAAREAELVAEHEFELETGRAAAEHERDGLSRAHAEETESLRKQIKAQTATAADLQASAAAAQKVLSETRAQLATAQEQLDVAATDAARLRADLEEARERSAGVEEALAAAEERGGGLEREVEAQRARADAAEGEAARLRALLAASQSTQQSQGEKFAAALLRRGDRERCGGAAIAIQRAWRRYQRRQLEAMGESAQLEWQQERQALSAETRHGHAQTGRALVLQSMQQVQATVQELLLEMLVSGKTLRRIRQAQRAAGVAQARPVAQR